MKQVSRISFPEITLHISHVIQSMTWKILLGIIFLENLGAWKITSTSTEGQKLHENLAPVLVTISGKSLEFSGKHYQYWFLPVLRPRRVSTSSDNKWVSQNLIPVT